MNCKNCGSIMLQEKTGTYRFKPPVNIPGGTMTVQNATWLECENCGEQLLPAALDTVLEELSLKRKQKLDYKLNTVLDGKEIEVYCTLDTAKVLLPIWSKIEPNLTACREIKTNKCIAAFLK